LFRREPSFTYESGLESGKKFLGQFFENCDLRGSRLSEFFRECLIEALIVGRVHVLVDFPRVSITPTNRAEEDAAGLSRAYLVRFQCEELINWSTDEHGQYEWVVLRQSVRKQPRFDSPDVVEETHWRYYSTTEYKTFRERKVGGKSTGIELVHEGLHALTAQSRVPLFTLQLSNGLWLMNKAAHLQLEHFNKSNALAWAITMGLFAMPVVYSDREWNQIVGESYYIQLGPTDKFGWTEPEGKVYQIAATNLEMLKEEIYRVCFLSQASGEMVSGHAQSALSKQMDFVITQEVLRAYAAATKDCIKSVVSAISGARGDGVIVSISGLDEADITDFASEIQDAKELLGLGITSPTLKRQLYRRLAMKYLNDLRQETKDAIAQEIDEQILS
jgi:hypothetical protein